LSNLFTFKIKKNFFFPHKKNSTQQIKKVLSNSYIWILIGPIEESLHDNRYILSITWRSLLFLMSRVGIYFILFFLNQHDTYNKFHNWFYRKSTIYINKSIKLHRKPIMVENFSKFYVPILLCQFTSSWGWFINFTIPYNPQQNGHAEKFFLTAH